jgi:hypothetical protein
MGKSARYGGMRAHDYGNRKAQMNSKPIWGKEFWESTRKDAMSSPEGMVHFVDDNLHCVAIFGKSMEPIIRTREEFFSETVRREVSSRGYKVAINGNMWDVTKVGLADVLAGHDPIPAGETIVKGIVTARSGGIKLGNSEPERFFVSYRGYPAPPSSFTSSFTIGFGDPPDEACGVGGLGPIIIDDLPYGAVNRYRKGVPAGAPTVGDPNPVFKPYLVQRSSRHFAYMDGLGPEIGKVVLALNRKADTLLVIVQPNDAEPGIRLETLREKLVAVGTNDAVFMDGSDSALLVVNGVFHVLQAENKDELTTIGLGFR